MVSTSGKEAENDVLVDAEGEADLDMMVQRVQGLFKFKNFTIRWTLAQSRG